MKEKTEGISETLSRKKIAIIGLPNTGKSQVFNNLTGKYTIVANYPHSTVEVNRTVCKIDNRVYEFLDTPGIHSLYPNSEEELLVRDMLMTEHPDIIIQCIDANQLKQSLTLTSDLIELGIPMLISLNSIDETVKKGIYVDSQGLSNFLGVPVVESIAVDGIGNTELVENIAHAKKGKHDLRYGDIIDNGITEIESLLPDELAYRRKIAILMLTSDAAIEEHLKDFADEDVVARLKHDVEGVRQQFNLSVHRVINDKRNRWIDNVVDSVIKKQRVLPRDISQTIARLSRNFYTGIPILLIIIAFMYFMVVDVASAISGLLADKLWVPVETAINGVVPPGFLHDFLLGEYGVLSLGFANAFLTILPILTVFFLVYGILEDVGYIPNLSVLTRRIFEKFGLSGAAIMPIVLGFSCKTMATLTTKSLHTKKEKYIAIFLIGFALPCSAQMGIDVSILGRMGFKSFVIAFSVLFAIEVAAGLILNRFMKEEGSRVFIQELPLIRLPSPKEVIRKTYYRLYWFIKEAGPVFLAAALLLFVSDKTGLLYIIRGLLSPIVTGVLGFPIKMVDVILLTVARREVAAGVFIDLIEKGQINYVQCIVAVVFTGMFIPCFANIGAMIRELGAKSAIYTVVAMSTSAVLLAGALNWILVRIL
ncbi:ferrous iron transport protein B [Candidatus Magnetobacterium casense]|uniref:Ferrous iron transport protein B n=1 Tax=Candidatus Magnetobacterium casense TaxID=1455061 RepID=A0ABS6RY78_9BACT|nr:ferrous iron transport protein B [Candidatus Magnetobacterium casensis]MBV6341594.1 ferrous iron transport protein B [Candidatus Magnetobacterium casensis]